VKKRAKSRKNGLIVSLLRRIHEELHREQEDRTLFDFCRMVQHAIGPRQE
jgi:hypothetical protein